MRKCAPGVPELILAADTLIRVELGRVIISQASEPTISLIRSADIRLRYAQRDNPYLLRKPRV